MADLSKHIANGAGTAITAESLYKKYKLYSNIRGRVKDALWPWGEPAGREFFALNDVSFKVNKGETLGVIGQNGSGKSTLLKIITGVLSPTLGRVAVEGRISALLELGAGFHPDFTGLENIYLNGTLMGISKDEMKQRVPQIIDFAGIGDYLYQPVKKYSSGMFVRLAFATSINVDPDILIVDEALSVGDMFFQMKCYKKFEDFRKAGKTILFVTHDLGTVVKYCDRAVVLDRGQMLGEGSPGKMVDLYKQALSRSNPSKIDGKNRLPGSQVKNRWQDHFTQNPDLSPYGTGGASIDDYGMFDHLDHPNSVLQKNESFAIRMKIKFQERIERPIFAFTIKDRKGTEICGTNTWVEKTDFEVGEKGVTIVVSFHQAMTLQGGQYLLSLGCTGFDAKGELVVYQRLYDVIEFDVVSSKDSVGFFDMNSQIVIEQTV